MANQTYGDIGAHRVPVWRIAGFALNNAATNLYLLFMSFVSCFYLGTLGIGLVAAISLTVILRLWDGASDPFVGFIIDRTNGKFGKNRPYMVIGNVLLCLTSWMMIYLTHRIPYSVVRFLFLLVVGAIYYIGYSFQCIATKSAQSCLTSDLEQRPLFAAFDSVFNILLLVAVAVAAPAMAKAQGGYTTDAFIHSLWIMTAAASAVFTVIAIYAIAPKDNRMYYVSGEKTTISDLRLTLRENRAIRTLVVAASTDKLALFTNVAAIAILNALTGFALFQTSILVCTAVPAAILAFVLTVILAVRSGQKEALRLASWVGIVLNIAMACLWLFGDPASMGEAGVGFFTIAYVAGTVLLTAFRCISGNLVIPMTADCVDYEIYRTGKSIPGLMSAMFSLLDKLVSALAPVIVGVVLAAIGFGEGGSVTSAKAAAVMLAYGMGILGLVCNLIAMKSYPLTKAKMAQIHSGIAAVEDGNED